MTTLYENDFYLWTQQTAALIRTGEIPQAELEHVAEEIEDMGNRDRNELWSRVKVLLAHMLKWQAQPNLQSRSWELTIDVPRDEIQQLLTTMPSLRRYLADHLDEIYPTALRLAMKESGLPKVSFPAECPYGISEILEPRE